MKIFTSPSLLIALLLSGNALATTSAPPLIDGQISTLAELKWLSENSSEWSKNWILTSDIDAADTTNWNGGLGFSPIGNDTTKFLGDFDGQEHTISNLFINRPNDTNVGLFGHLQSDNFSNLVLENANVTGKHYVGSIAGFSDWVATTNLRTVNATVVGESEVGGVFGYIAKGTTANISVEDVDVTTTTDNAGGFAGISSNVVSLTNLYVSGNVSSARSAGGVTASAGNVGTWDDVTVKANVSGDTLVGGIAGSMFTATLNNVHVEGSIVATGHHAAGIVASAGMPLEVDGCSFKGVVNGLENVGGIFSTANLPNILAKNCTVQGDINGTYLVGGAIGSFSNFVAFENIHILEGSRVQGTAFVGGLYGTTFGSSAQAHVNVSSKAHVVGEDYVGGLVGSYNAQQALEFQQSYFDGTIEAKNNGGGIIGGVPVNLDLTETMKGRNSVSGETLTLTNSYASPLFVGTNGHSLIGDDLSDVNLILTSSYTKQTIDDSLAPFNPPLFSIDPISTSVTDSYYGSLSDTNSLVGLTFLTDEQFGKQVSFTGFSFSNPWAHGTWRLDHSKSAPVLNQPEIPIFTTPNQSDGDLQDIELTVGDSIYISINATMPSSGTNEGVSYEVLGDTAGVTSISNLGELIVNPTDNSQAGELSLIVLAKHGTSENSLAPFKVTITTNNNGGETPEPEPTPEPTPVPSSGGSTGLLALSLCAAALLFRRKR